MNKEINVYVIYYESTSFEKKQRMYLVDLPDDDDPLAGVGFQSDRSAAGTCPTLADAHKVVAWLKEDPSDRNEYLWEMVT